MTAANPDTVMTIRAIPRNERIERSVFWVASKRVLSHSARYLT
jgi:hypothetical protein